MRRSLNLRRELDYSSIPVKKVGSGIGVGLPGELKEHAAHNEGHGLNVRVEFTLVMSEFPVFVPRIDIFDDAPLSSLFLVGHKEISIVSIEYNLFRTNRAHIVITVIPKISEKA